MYSVYHMSADELNYSFLDSLKVLFEGKKLQIIVGEVDEIPNETETTDETDYLLQSKANQQRLFAAIENVERGRNLMEFDFDSLEETAMDVVS
ncbi:MAG: hypothetical protein AAF639_28000 [Chloroflexota bacterium]